MKQEKPSMSIEATLQRLGQIAAQLDNPKTGLEQSIELFSEGARLVQQASECLAQAQLKIEQLLPKEIDLE